MIFKKYEFMHKGKFYYIFFENAGFDSEYVDVWMGDSTRKEAVVYTTLYGEHPLAKNIDCYYLGGWYYRILIDKGYFEAFVCLALNDESIMGSLVDNFNKQIKNRENVPKSPQYEAILKKTADGMIELIGIYINPNVSQQEKLEYFRSKKVIDRE